jgi:PHD/YefM family antitoxin component YafN of YafNO toxin-antitoxin module
MSKKQLETKPDISPQLNKLDYRVDEQEDLDNDLERFIQMKDLQWHSEVSEFKRELNFMREQVNELRRKVSMLKHNFVMTVEEFRTKSTSEDFNKLKNRVDDLDMENFVSKNEFKRKLLD